MWAENEQQKIISLNLINIQTSETVTVAIYNIWILIQYGIVDKSI